MLKRPDVSEGSGLYSRFGIPPDLQFYVTVAFELQAHGQIERFNVTPVERTG